MTKLPVDSVAIVADSFRKAGQQIDKHQPFNEAFANVISLLHGNSRNKGHKGMCGTGNPESVLKKIVEAVIGSDHDTDVECEGGYYRVTFAAPQPFDKSATLDNLFKGLGIAATGVRKSISGSDDVLIFQLSTEALHNFYDRFSPHLGKALQQAVTEFEKERRQANTADWQSRLTKINDDLASVQGAVGGRSPRR